MRRRLYPVVAALVAALVAGCAGQPPDAASFACRAAKLAELTLGGERSYLSVLAEVDGKPATLLVDTASESSILTPAAVDRLGLARDAGSVLVFGAGGQIRAGYARLRTIALAGLEVAFPRVVVTPLNTPSGVLGGVDGVLGADWLHRFDLELDLPHRRLALYPAGACPGGPALAGPMISVPVKVVREGLALLTAALDGRPLVAILDSGASSTTLNSLSPDAAPLIPAGPGTLSRTMGVDGNVRIRRDHRFGQLRIGSIAWAPAPIAITTVAIPVDLLLGVNWLVANRVWLSYAGRRLTIMPLAPQ